ncbi:MAG: hypothetical protein ACKOSQ_06425 [Planctomycetaceae bacterium]
MKTSRMTRALVVAAVATLAAPAAAQECCLSSLFAGCGCCLFKPPVYAVAPVVAPVVAPAPVVAAPPPPVMVPVQQTSYVPETTYRTQYQCVPVTSYKPSCEIDPCTGCATECMQPVTQYVQQAVNVPVTQYRAVTTTKYVQMQPPGYAAPAAMGAPAMPGPAAAAASPFVAPAAPPAQPGPQGWGAAGADVSQQLVPGQQSINPPALPTTGYMPVQVPPQAGTFVPQATFPVQPQPTAPPALAPAPALKPSPELPRTPASGSAAAALGAAPAASHIPAQSAAGTTTSTVEPPSLVPGSGNTTAPAAQPATSGSGGMPLLPGTGPTGATRAFPRLLEPTSHTTSWQPAVDVRFPATFPRPAYPTAALPATAAR